MAVKTELLAPELTIYTVGALRDHWLTWLSEPDGKRSKSRRARELKLDGSKVHDIDASGVQLLLALCHSLAAQGRSLLLVNPSNALQVACDSLGAQGIVAMSSEGEAA